MKQESGSRRFVVKSLIESGRQSLQMLKEVFLGRAARACGVFRGWVDGKRLIIGCAEHYFMDERETRVLIDGQLRMAGWRGEYVKEEVNSVGSDFRAKEYVLSGGKGGGSGRFIDYLLLAEDYSPLAIVEAKRASASEDGGRAQARTYARDVESQTGEKVPVFLTNGNSWRLIDQDGEREVSGPFSQDDLKRRAELFRMRRDPTRVGAGRIVDRPSNVLIVKQLVEHFQSGRRSALVSMATGSGKTRVAMAVIDVLLRSSMVRNVLFIADRIALANQAKSAGFQEFFKEPVTDLRDKPESFPNGLYVSTVQTLRKGGGKRVFEEFSPGFFDLVVFDEAHRSIYDANRTVYRYFDAIKIGLTATPSIAEDKNTFDLFECEGEKPTVEYTYEKAVREGVLVPYRAEVFETKVLSLGIEGASLSGKLKDQLRRQEENPEEVDLSGSSFARVFMDDRTNELVVREFMSRCRKSDEGKPAKTIFFCASVAHAKHLKRVFGRLYPQLGSDVQTIVSKDYRYLDELARFKLDSEPRIALSVGVLDTGVDVPEVCNLVFARPVFSGIRFWQMLGRGTRSLSACRRREWLPERGKSDFLIMDFAIGGHSNVKEHGLKKSEDGKRVAEVPVRIFLGRVALLKKRMIAEQRRFVERKIVDEIGSLDQNSFIVREKLPLIRKIVSGKRELRSHVSELEKEIAPLMSLSPGKNPLVSSFVLQVEKLRGYVLDGNGEKIYAIRKYVSERMESVLQKGNLEKVREKRADVLKVLQEKFWDDLTFDDVEFIVRELAPLMAYYEKAPGKLLQVDAPDLVLKVEKFRKDAGEDDDLKRFLKSNPLVGKIRSGKGITAPELLQLERQLGELRPEITVENVQSTQNVDFLAFMYRVLGLKRERDHRELIEQEFDRHVIEKNGNYNSEQIRFLQVLKKVFSRAKRIEMKDFASPPLSNERPLDRFETSQLEWIVAECNKIKMR